MLFSKSLVGNSRVAKDQYDQVKAARHSFKLSEKALMPIAAPMLRANGFKVNEGAIPDTVYQEFDRTTVTRFRSDDGDTFLNDLLPLSKSINIGKLVHKFRRASDAGTVITSVGGQSGVIGDNTVYNFDGAIVPIHETGFKRGWREMAGQTSEGFDSLIDDQREHLATLRSHLADQFLDGHKDKKGQYIVIDGVSWQGMRNDSRVAQIDLGAGGINFDFTDTTKTYEQIEAAFKQVRDVLFITNDAPADVTVYVSRQIASNIERFSSEYVSSSNGIPIRLSMLQGISTIKSSSKLTGNEMMLVPLTQDLVQPLVGMGINTVAIPRVKWDDDYEFSMWGAIGFKVKTDYSNKKCSAFAKVI